MVCAALLLVLELAGFAFFVAGTHGWVTPLRRPVSTDFVSFYAAGRLVDAGTAALVYDQAAHHAAEQAATEPGIAYNYFYYPPIFLLLCAVLARLPYLAAFVAFQAATLVPSLLVVRRILHERGWAILLPLLAFPPVFFTLGTGQNAFLSATLFGAATLLVDRRPALAGMLFGALCYKPHFGLLVPVALVAAGRWRSCIAAGLTVAGLIGLSVQMLGWDTWRAFFTAASGAHEIYETGVAHPAMASPFGVGTGVWRLSGAGIRGAGGGDGDHGRDGVLGLAPRLEPARARRDIAGGDAARSAGSAVLRPGPLWDRAGLVGAMGPTAWLPGVAPNGGRCALCRGIADRELRP